jgi:trehalose 6-phosphate phosphatase
MNLVSDLPSLTDRHALFLDFDGTLAPIQVDPDGVALPEGVAEAIIALQGLLSEAIVVISGRDIRDLSNRIPVDICRAGGHGLEVCAAGETPAAEPEHAPPGLMQAINVITHGLDGVRIEPKGPVIAVHYRLAPDLGPMLEARLGDCVSTIEGYKLQAGKMVFEAKPEGANKGKAVSRLMQQDGFRGRIPVMVGDDTTDEDAFAVVNALGGFAIKVGDGDTVATYRLDSPEHVANWIKLQGSE